jgi:DnaK suppressor protein
MEKSPLTPDLLIYFESRLRQWHQSLMQDNHELLHSIQDETHQEPDPVDQGTIQEDWQSRFQLMENKEKTLQEIEAALHRIADGSFGISEISGKPIDIKRLEAWPIARCTVEEEEHKSMAY